MAGQWRVISAAVGYAGLGAVLGIGSGCARIAPEPRRGSLEQLERMADDIRTRAVARDINGLMRYARGDIRADPSLVEPLRPALQEYLVTIREVLVGARDLRVRIEDLGRDEKGVHWARLIFYDRAVIPEATLVRPDFLCHHDLTKAVAWTFNARNGWESVGYPFDAFTDIHCPP